MRGSVVRNGLFSPIWRYYGLKSDILDYWETLTFLNVPIISYQCIKVHRVERMDIGKI